MALLFPTAAVPKAYDITADSLRALEESERRIELERERLALLRMRATGAVDVPDPEIGGESFADGGEEEA